MSPPHTKTFIDLQLMVVKAFCAFSLLKCSKWSLEAAFDIDVTHVLGLSRVPQLDQGGLECINCSMELQWFFNSTARGVYYWQVHLPKRDCSARQPSQH